MSEGTLTQIPAPRVPIIDERTGLITREWFRFFNNIYVLTGGDTEGVIPVSSGGTGATSASQARANLQAGTVNRVLGQGNVNGLFLTGNVTTEGAISLNGTLRLDTFIIGALAVNNGGSGVQCTGITTQTGDFSVTNADLYLINDKSGSTCVVTLPDAVSWPGRALHFKNTQAQALDSASSDVVPITGGSASTGILGATSGAWATLVSDGTNWVIMATG